MGAEEACGTGVRLGPGSPGTPSSPHGLCCWAACLKEWGKSEEQLPASFGAAAAFSSGCEADALRVFCGSGVTFGRRLKLAKPDA